MIYQNLHKLHQQGFSIAKISGLTGVNWRTVKAYLSMSSNEFEAFIENKSARKRILLPYENFIKNKLEKFQDTSAAQMHDWLKEGFPEFPETATRTLFDFVMWVRQKYNLPNIKPVREYEMVEELVYGKQAQADFGAYTLRNGTGKRERVYFIVIQLSRSRYKYIWFSNKHFTTERSITGHERAFAFFKGVPEQIVYDQDRVFIVSENKGDLLLTEGFKAYTKERNFEIHFCRKADPESKGKIENVVKYVKHNFLYNRCFCDIETLNEEALQWLDRTGNKMPHGTTKLSPHNEWLKEQSYLGAYPEFICTSEPESYTVRKDNTITYKSNFYSVPRGTFKGKGTIVTVGLSDDIYLVISSLNGDLLCKHMIAIGMGKKVLNTDHKRDKNIKINTLVDEVCGCLGENGDLGRQFLNTIRIAKPRYIRDQVLLFRDTIDTIDAATTFEALTYCCENNIESAIDFKAIVEHRMQEKIAVISNHPGQTMQRNPLNGALPPAALMEPETSSIKDYQDIF